jgi:hypothetical protein
MAIAAREQRAPGLTDWQEEGRPDEAFPEPEPPGPVLDLADLMLDENGEVVLFNDSNLRSLALCTEARLVRRGEVGRHVTATGEDVSGFHYLAFDNGAKIFFRPGLEVVVAGAKV